MSFRFVTPREPQSENEESKPTEMIKDTTTDTLLIGSNNVLSESIIDDPFARNDASYSGNVLPEMDIFSAG